MLNSVLRIAALLLVSKTGVLIAGMGLQCTVDSQCLEYLGYVTLLSGCKKRLKLFGCNCGNVCMMT